MQRQSLLQSTSLTWGELFGNGKIYRVPPYQRDYSWRQEHWEDLWSDVLELWRDPTRRHYLGCLVLQPMREREFSVIDGQQRLATLTILAIAVIRTLQDLVKKGIDTENNERRLRILRESFLGREDATSLRYSSKLQLNAVNRDLFEDYLVLPT